MTTYRIMTNGFYYRIQYKQLWWWKWEINHLGGIMEFDCLEEAKDYIDTLSMWSLASNENWKEVKNAF